MGCERKLNDTNFFYLQRYSAVRCTVS